MDVLVYNVNIKTFKNT